jgi:hypothetical protein
MKKYCIILSLAVFAAVVILWGLSTGSADAAEYVGVAKCKMCHSSKALGGQQYKVWEKSKHAVALDALKGDDAKNPECLGCHTTGGNLPGVQCEACHGPGSKYRSPKIMSKKAYKTDRDAARKAALDAGLIIPTEEVCKKCHNEKSPQFKGFDFAAYKEKIKHW